MNADELENLARQLPRHAPGPLAVLRLAEAVHRLAPHARRTEFGPVMDFEELAEYLRVDTATVGLYLDQIPSFELDGKLLFRRKSVEQWIEQKEMRLQWQPVRSEAGMELESEPVEGGVSWMRSISN